MLLVVTHITLVNPRQCDTDFLSVLLCQLVILQCKTEGFQSAK